MMPISSGQWFGLHPAVQTGYEMGPGFALFNKQIRLAYNYPEGPLTAGLNVISILQCNKLLTYLWRLRNVPSLLAKKYQGKMMNLFDVVSTSELVEGKTLNILPRVFAYKLFSTFIFQKDKELAQKGMLHFVQIKLNQYY